MSLLLAFLRDLFDAWIEVPFTERVTILVLLAGSPAVWIHEALRYGKLGKKDPNVLRLAPIAVRGPLPDALGPGGVAAALAAELASIREALDRVLGTRPAPYLAPAIGADSGYYLVGLRREAPIPIEVSELEVEKIQQAMVLHVGSVSVPVGELMDLMIAVVAALPVPFRDEYRRGLIRVSIVHNGEQSRLQVSRAAQPMQVMTPHTATAEFRAANSAVVFTETVTTRTLAELGEVIRDAAFMILEMQGSFGGRRWRGMRRLLDGLEALDEYRRTGAAAARDRARQMMREAAEADPENLEALYFHGSLTMVDQTDGAVDRAVRCFERALVQDSPHSTKPGKLRAMAHTGLAYCHAQRWHRLGKRRRDVLAEALRHTEEAEREWGVLQRHVKTPGGLQLHPLIPYTRALVTTVDEGTSAPGDDRVERFTRARELYLQAIALQPDNGMFYNNLGWVLLKLAEWGVAVPPSGTAKHEAEREAGHDVARDAGRDAGRDVAIQSEEFLQKALGLNPLNKLTHANLCLLYSVPRFRESRDDDFFQRSRYHGLRAVRIDPSYVNGHRDLAVALVRYGRLDEAYTHYTKALELADLPDKDRELINDLVTELERRRGVSASELKRWKNPPSVLLEPEAIGT